MSRNQEEPIFNCIEELRMERGISRSELARLVGVHYQTIGYLERGEYNPSLSLALKISEVFKIEISEIFSANPIKKRNKNEKI